MTDSNDLQGQHEEPKAQDSWGEAGYRYKAFISYRHTERDRKLAKWLHGAIEGYRTPGRLVEQGVQQRVGKVFRDEEELAASSNLSSEIEQALRESEFLVVVCSPRTPGSQWVNQEVSLFRQLGRSERILACLIEGEPADSFPPALIEVHSGATADGGQARTIEPLAADFRQATGAGAGAARRVAKLKLLSTLLNCRFDDLVAREQARRRRLLMATFGVLFSVIGVIAVLGVIAWTQRNVARTERSRAESERDAALLTQSRFLTDLSTQQTDAGNASVGMLLAMEALPTNWAAWDRPYYPAAMTALYRAVMAQREVLAIGVPLASGNSSTMHVNDAVLNRDGSRLLVGNADGSVALWDIAMAKKALNWKIAIMPVKRVLFGNEGNQAWAVAGPNVHRVDLDSGNSRVEVTADADIVDIRIDEGRRRILTVDDKHTARLWTSESGAYRAHPPVRLFEGLLDYHAFSGDSQFVVSGGSQTNEIVVANLLTGAMHQLITLRDLGVSGGGTFNAVFSNTGDRLLISAGPVPVLWDIRARRKVRTISGHHDTVLRAAFAPDDSLIATGSEDGTVMLWSRKDGYAQAIATFSGFVRGANEILSQGAEIEQSLLLEKRMREDFEGAVGYLAFSADGRRLLATSGDRSIRVWDVEKRRAIAKVSGHSERIDRALIYQDGSMVVTIGREGSARLWRMTPDDEKIFYSGDAAVLNVTMPPAPGGPVVWGRHSTNRCGGTWRVWRADKGVRMDPLSEESAEDMQPDIGSVSLDGRSYVSGFRSTGRLIVVDTVTGAVTHLQAGGAGGEIDCVYVAPGGRQLLITRESGEEVLAVPESTANNTPSTANEPGGAPRNDLVSEGNLWWLLSPDGSRKLGDVAQAHKMDRAEINRAGTRLLLSRTDDAVALYDAVSAREVRRFEAARDGNDVKFSDDGNAIIGMTPEAVRVWSSIDGALTREIKLDGAKPAFASLGGVGRQLLAVAGSDGKVRIFGPEANASATMLGGTFPEGVRIAINADGRRAIVDSGRCGASGDNETSIWDVPANRKIADFAATGGCAYGLTFSGDGSQVVGAVTEPVHIVVWESEGGAELISHRPCLPEGAEMGDGDPSQLLAAGFSDNNTYVYGGTLYGAVCVWRNPGAGQTLIERARSLTPRGLTTAERKEFFLADRENPLGR